MVKIFEDGSKERFTMEDEFIPSFPESIDLKITNYCDMGCVMCHESSSIEGKHADLSAPFIDTLHEGTELAIGGGNPLSHPDLLEFLKHLKSRGIIANITVNEKHLLKNLDYIKMLISEKLIYGLGISLNEYNKETFEFASTYPNTVFHLILGMVDIDRLSSFPKGYKVLLLGYKKFGRGKDYYHSQIDKNIEEIEEKFMQIRNNFSHISFDNLALEQLHVEHHLPRNVYKNSFMGEDGKFTMYIDLVNKKYGSNSTSVNRYDLKDNIQEMFLDPHIK